VVEVRETPRFRAWRLSLRDLRARDRIAARIRRLELGNPGDVRPVGEGVFELRIHWGPGYRIYCVNRGRRVVVLLAGGDKRSQAADIQDAIQLARAI